MSYLFLQVDGDPTIWKLSEPIDAETVTRSDHPLRIPVVAPLPGTLVVSGRVTASVALLSPLDVPGGTGATPNGVEYPKVPFVYLPSTLGLKSPPGYQLSSDTDLAALENSVADALRQRTFHTVEFSDSVLLINGAAVPFVALFRASAG